MKPFLLFLACFSLLASQAQGISKTDRKAAIQYFKQTQKEIQQSFKGLSENQLAWKPNDSTWSVANCMEHIAISEKNIFDWFNATVKGNPTPERRSEIKMADEDIKTMLTNRSFKVKTSEAFKPSGQFGNTNQAFAVFVERRKAVTDYLRSTNADLRNYVAETPIGKIDGFQLLLFLAAHSKRHQLQMEEVKAMAAFPAN